MSRFFSKKYAGLAPYVPGEQPKDKKYIKLNANESPFPPSEKAVQMASEAAKRLQLYPDPDCKELTAALAKLVGVEPEELILTNGSDEILNFAFMAYCDEETPAAFADLTYGFYPIFCDINRVPYTEIPLKDDFTIDIKDYFGLKKTIFIANPNAPTGLALPVSDIEEIIKANPDNIVVVDEAYVDFGAESCIPLIHKYDNLLVCQTFSKSRSMASARLGFGVGCKALIQDINSIKYTTNPFNINLMTMAAGLGVVQDEEYTRANCKTIMENREWFTKEINKLGFITTDSKTNFVFATHPDIGGEEIYTKVRERGILIRYFKKDRIKNYNRITIGTMEEMKALAEALAEIVKEAAPKASQ